MTCHMRFRPAWVYAPRSFPFHLLCFQCASSLCRQRQLDWTIQLAVSRKKLFAASIELNSERCILVRREAIAHANQVQEQRPDAHHWRVESASHIIGVADEIDRQRTVNEKQSCHLPWMARRIPDSQVCPQRPADQNRSIRSNLVHYGLRIRQEALQGGVVRGGG